MRLFSLRFRSTIVASLALSIGMLSGSPIKAQAAFESGKNAGGFACTLGDIPVIGINGASGISVNIGVFTSHRVSEIRNSVGDLFVAFHENDHDYVITDPELVNQAVRLFVGDRQLSSESAATKAAASGSSVIPPSAVSRLRQLIAHAKFTGKVQTL